ncbi:hypothetical protein [Chryseobacterium sp. PET-29]|uniref:hypothetical protein n=1 Tax=Chryseobacterium sp. PET-29 TaxID=2983267 RepID=UPI0021E59521|nr:hypothetical protein [Chryseobacterium sp. PET-29]
MAKKSTQKQSDNSKKIETFRSAETGRFVTKQFAKRNPKSTIKETRTGGPKSRNNG